MMATATQTDPRPCVSGDLGDFRVVTVGGIQDLTQATSARAHVAFRDGDDTATLTAAVTDTVAREVTVQLGVLAGDWLGSGPALGDWDIRVEVTAPGWELSWPDGEPDTLTVGSAVV